MVKFFEVMLARNADGKDGLLAVVAARSKAEAYELSTKQYRKEHDIPSSQQVHYSVLNVSDNEEEGTLFHLRLLDKLAKRQEKTND